MPLGRESPGPCDTEVKVSDPITQAATADYPRPTWSNPDRLSRLPLRLRSLLRLRLLLRPLPRELPLDDPLELLLLLRPRLLRLPELRDDPDDEPLLLESLLLLRLLLLLELDDEDPEDTERERRLLLRDEALLVSFSGSPSVAGARAGEDIASPTCTAGYKHDR